MSSVDRLDWPVIELTSVAHVGRLDLPAPETRLSLYASRGLFVSTEPEAWTEIARLGGMPTWELTRRDGASGRFLDILSLSRKQRAELDAAAIDAGWVRHGAIYRFSHYDDEFEQTFVQEFFDHEDAKDEAPEDARIRCVPGLAPTPAFTELWETHFVGRLNPGAVREIARELVIEARGDLDGYWYNERLDPARLSAPQGVIFPSRLDAWDRRIIAEPELRRTFRR